MHTNIFSLLSFSLKAQTNEFNTPDSLKNKSFEELRTMFYNNESSLTSDSIIANTYLIKAIRKRDTFNIVNAYCFLTSTTNNLKLKEKYFDIGINLTKNNPSYNFPSLLYSLKAGVYEERKDFKTSLDYFLLAHDSALEQGNLSLVNMMKYNIGVYKLNIGMYKDAIIYGKELWEDMKSKPLSDQYLNTLYLVSSAYTNNSKLDSASIFNRLGITKSLELKSKKYFSKFSLLEGVNQFHRSKYTACIDSLDNSLPQLIEDNDTENVAITYYFLGNSII